MDDKKIVALYFERNEEAIVQSRKQFSAYLGAIAHGILREKRDEEECLNDVYLRAWNSIPPQRPNSLKAYLGTICRNLSLNRLQERERLKRGGGALEVACGELEECIPDRYADDIADAVALKTALNGFILSLKPESRILFVQRYWYMRSIEEIAEDCAMSPNAVKVSLHRSREKLRAYLLKEGFDI